LWWRKNKNKEACIVLHNSLHSIKVQKDYFEDPTRKIHIETILHSMKGMPQIRRVTDERVRAITQISVE
jgi:hypothetical protein